MDWTSWWPDRAGEVALVQAFASSMAWAALAALALLVPVFYVFSRMIRRRFWCARAQREVEVLVEERGLPGLAHASSVTSCSVFDPPTAVACTRRCLDAEFRRRWPPALPIWQSSRKAD
jgi:hypothetical protein